MESLREQFDTRRRPLIILSLYAIVVGLLTVLLNMGSAIDGEFNAVGRTVIGFIGVLGAIAAWTYRQSPVSGWHILMFWALVQIPIYTTNPDGAFNEQVIRFPLVATSETIVNNELISYSAIGVNLVGIILLIVTSRYREDFTARRVPLNYP